MAHSVWRRISEYVVEECEQPLTFEQNRIQCCKMAQSTQERHQNMALFFALSLFYRVDHASVELSQIRREVPVEHSVEGDNSGTSFQLK